MLRLVCWVPIKSRVLGMSIVWITENARGKGRTRIVGDFLGNPQTASGFFLIETRAGSISITRAPRGSLGRTISRETPAGAAQQYESGESRFNHPDLRNRRMRERAFLYFLPDHYCANTHTFAFHWWQINCLSLFVHLTDSILNLMQSRIENTAGTNLKATIVFGLVSAT